MNEVKGIRGGGRAEENKLTPKKTRLLGRSGKVTKEVRARKGVKERHNRDGHPKRKWGELKEDERERS